MKSRNYKNLVFTKHALERLNDRSISQHAVWQTVTAADKEFPSGDSTKYIRTISGRKYHIVAKYLADEKKYLVISVWVRGEDDKVPLVWWLLQLPFRFMWWQVKLIFRGLKFVFWR